MKIRTPQIERCWYSNDSKKCNILFNSSSHLYCYSKDRVVWLKNPVSFDPRYSLVKYQGKTIDNIMGIHAFQYASKTYYHITRGNAHSIDASDAEITIERNCLQDKTSADVFEYFKHIAEINSLKADDKMPLLLKQYNHIDFIPEDRVVTPYLNPHVYHLKQFSKQKIIFPFGCNASQKKAIQTAFESQASIIQGPPGTGKTQTILNIIANIIIQGKSVLVVSNNNSATSNVVEKLSKCHMDFMTAFLGSYNNKELFLEEQQTTKSYPPQLSAWHNENVEDTEFLEKLEKLSEDLDALFCMQEKLALAKQELKDIELESKHYQNESSVKYHFPDTNKHIPSKKLINLLISLKELKRARNKEKKYLKILRQWMTRIKWILLFHRTYQFSYQHLDKHIEELQLLFYHLKHNEIEEGIRQIDAKLTSYNVKEQTEKLVSHSMEYFKNYIFHKYNTHKEKNIFSSIPRNTTGSKKFIEEYPIILSTTFSARNCLAENHAYDYVIIDESSQVSPETGVLALTCARNCVIVGDSKQLPNVVTEEDKLKYQAIFQQFNISESYDCGKVSFLDSISQVIPDIPQTLLKEHYRCHPKIINFCNQKFYGGKLVIMTDDHQEADVIHAYRTVVGNHARDHMNQREIDVIRQEVLPHIEGDDIGIIAPYNNQVEALQKELQGNLDIATVHKFQGREKDAIILSTVDDTVTSFSDNPNLLNVAISRAKKNFYLVVSGNGQPENSNIHDLIGYIEYNNCKITESNIRSVYDYLYKQYEAQRMAILKRRKHISEYDSENITYALLQKIFQENPNWSFLDVVCHQPLNTLIKDFSLLDEEERIYAQHIWTHIDFLIFNRVNKQPVLALEIDGYAFHKKESKQGERDRKKDHILEIYNLPLLRLSTTGSNERNVITEKLNNILNN